MFTGMHVDSFSRYHHYHYCYYYYPSSSSSSSSLLGFECSGGKRVGDGTIGLEEEDDGDDRPGSIHPYYQEPEEERVGGEVGLEATLIEDGVEDKPYQSIDLIRKEEGWLSN